MRKKTLEELEVYYQDLIREEEKRIRELTRKAFARKKHIHSHPSSVLGIKVDLSPVRSERVKQLRDKAIALSKITREDIYDATSNYLFDNNLLVIKDWVENHFKVPNNKYWHEIERVASSMSDEEKRLFVELGYAISLRQEYEAIQEDIRNDDDHLFFEHFIFRLEDAKRRYRDEKEKYF